MLFFITELRDKLDFKKALKDVTTIKTNLYGPAGIFLHDLRNYICVLSEHGEYAFIK